MKKLIFAAFICTFSVSFAQEKKINFTKKLNYKITFKKTEKEPAIADFKFQSYVGKNKEFLTTGNIRGQIVNFYTENNNTHLVNIGLNNRLTANNVYLLNGYQLFEDEVFEQKFAASKLNTSETILGIPCENFILKPIFVNNGEENNNETENLKACINEKHAINNMPVLSSIFNSLENFRKVDFNISGLILKMGPEKTYNEEHLVLESITDNNDYALIDSQKLIADTQKAKDSIIALTNEWKKLYSDSAVANVDSAAAIRDYDLIPEYKSTYKIEPKRDTVNLAIENESSEHFLKGIPKHCTNIDKEMPKFEMKDLDYHVKNYVGQMCDMYLTQSYAHSVAIKITLDEIRREALYLLHIREKLSDKDRKKLDKYLDSLD